MRLNHKKTRMTQIKNAIEICVIRGSFFKQEFQS